MTRFELATTRPPDVYSNRAELHPELFLSLLENFLGLLKTCAKVTFVFFPNKP